MSEREQHPAVREMKRELAVARQTIRSLQDAADDTQRSLDLANACIDALEVAMFGSLEGRSRDTLEARAAALASSGSEREQENAVNDPTLQELHAVMAGYDDPNDKLTIALGNFNRVRAERDASREREQELERERDSYAAQYDEVVKEAGALLEREQELTNALRKYGYHLVTCHLWPKENTGLCTCGFDAAVAPAVEEQR